MVTPTLSPIQFTNLEEQLGKEGSTDPRIAERIGQVPATAVTGDEGKRTATAVLGKQVLAEYAKDRARTVLPSWVNPAPAKAGHTRFGKLSADQWRSFCTISLVVTLIRIWGMEPPESRFLRMLHNFLDLVTAVEIGSMLVTSRKHASIYGTTLRRYLDNLKLLYPEATIAPNHHLALHLPDFLVSLGPSPEYRIFGPERHNWTGQRTNTNNHYGE